MSGLGAGIRPRGKFARHCLERRREEQPGESIHRVARCPRRGRQIRAGQASMFACK